jgi:hypothetical protein
VNFLGGNQGEAVFEVETELVSEDAACAGAGAVILDGPVVEHVLEEVEIGFHGRGVLVVSGSRWAGRKTRVTSS